MSDFNDMLAKYPSMGEFVDLTEATMRTDVESFQLLWGVDPSGVEGGIPENYKAQQELAIKLANEGKIVNPSMVKALFGIEKK